MDAIAPSTPQRPAVEVRNRAMLTFAVMLATIMQILDTTIANVAIPHMQSNLGATIDSVNWVLTSYIIAVAIAIPITGWLSEQIGQRRLFLGAVSGFILASMACGAATSLEEMVLFRIFQGISAAFIGPLSQAVMLDINPPERHARAMSIWGMGIMAAPIMGPVIGGWLTENYSWRWVFYVNLPVGIIALSLLWALLPVREVRKRKFDLFGFSMLAIGLGTFQLLLDRGASEDWFNSTEIWIETGVCIAALWMFGVQMKFGRNPLFGKQLLGNRNLMTSVFLLMVIGMVMFASMALLPPMLQRLFGYPVIDSGLILAVRGIGILASMAVAGRLAGIVDSRVLIGFGLTIAAFSLWQMSQWSLAMDSMPVLVSGFVQGIGMGFVFIPLNIIAFATLEPEQRTDGSSLLNLSRSLGGSIGISIVSTLLARNTQVSHADIVQNVTNSSISALDPTSLDRFGNLGVSALQLLNLEVTRQAMMVAYIDDFWFMMWATLLALPLVIMLRSMAGQSKAPPIAA